MLGKSNRELALSARAGSAPAKTESDRLQEMKRPLFWTVTGSDFGRAIRWARSQPNAMTQAIRNALLP